VTVPELTPDAAHLRLGEGDCVFVDVRDPGSYAQAHVPGALHVTDMTIGEFVSGADKAVPVIVYCYHGNSSKGGAAYLLQQGFAEVYSMSGGFEEWRRRHPTEP
jgi:thiosulfate sulfurtransferase